MIADTSTQDQYITNKGKTIYWRWLSVACLILLSVVAVAPALSRWYQDIPNIKRDKLQIARVVQGDLTRDIAVSGRLVASNAPQVYSSEAGVVELLVNPGDAVTLHQVVARVISPELTALIQQQQARVKRLTIEAKRGSLADKESKLDLQRQLDKATIELNTAQREYNRSLRSYKKSVISQSAWAKAQDVLKEAKLLYQHSLEKIELAKQRLLFEKEDRQNAIQQQQFVLDELLRRQQGLNITAPISGLVGNWSVKQREQVSAATALMSIVDLSQYDAELNVPQSYAKDLGWGLLVELQLGGYRLMASITSVSPEIKNGLVQVKVRFEPTKPITLRQNQRINARIEFEKKNNVLMVKRGSFLNTGQGHSYRLLTDNTAEKIKINTGISNMEYVEVVSGLNVDDEIIVSSYDRFIDSDKIRVIN